MPLFFTNQGQENPLRRNANDRRSSLQPAPPTVPVFKQKGTDLKPAIPDRLPAVPAMTPSCQSRLVEANPQLQRNRSILCQAYTR